MKPKATAISALIFLTLVACGNDNQTAAQPEESETTALASQIDLHTAVATKNVEAIRQHIEAGSDLNVLEPTHASTPLITAAAFGNTEAAKLLVEAGADLNHKNKDGSTALHTAAAFGKTEAAKLLIDSGAELDHKNNDGSTPLHTAAFLGRVEIVQALLDKGADKTVKNIMRQTALEVVEIPFEDVKVVYDAVGAGLEPLGIVLDYDQIKTARPIIAEMLK